MVTIECVALEKRLKDKEREFHLKVPSFSVSSGERKAIVGATGSGKTTVMDILAMVSMPDSCTTFRLSQEGGSVDLLRAMRSRRALARLRADIFGYVMQKSPLFPFLTVAENVDLQQQVSKRRDRRYADTIMGMLGVDTLARALPAELSVGQKQRTAIARSLSHRPSIILCDEPTGSLDPVTARQSMETILWAADTTNAAVVMITHDWKLASQFGFSFHVMQTERRQGHVTVNVMQPLDDRAVERQA